MVLAEAKNQAREPEQSDQGCEDAMSHQLMMSEDDHSAAHARASSDPEGKKSEKPRALKILLVEDNVVNERVAQRMLQKFGHHVAVASNGAQAVTMFQAEQWDLILMDIQMPIMNGEEATQKIREIESHTGSSTPIIAVTALAFAYDKERLLKLGMDEYLAKPYTQSALLDVIGRAVKLKRGGPAK